MERRTTVLDWIASLGDECVNLAIDDGGLTLVALDDDGREIGQSYELGGIPRDD